MGWWCKYFNKRSKKTDEIIATIKRHGLDLDKQKNGGLAEYLRIDTKTQTDGSLEMTQKSLINW